MRETRQSPQAGFTLLEMMVVVVLIAISMTFAVISLDRDNDDVAELEARRFARLVEHARDESILSGRPFAVQVNPADRSYTFLRYGGEWIEVKHDEVFRRRVLPEDLKLEFEIPGDSDGGGLLVVEGLGVITPFIFTVRGDTGLYRVSVDQAQNVVVQRETDATG
jgi:type II secretion system protein H